jgi:glyoxylase-like metal-dependent hydrolase (beta-lactamase superfamily II)
VQWVLETHVHADHLSAGLYFRERLGARIGIGKNIASVQDHWSGAFNYKPGLAPDPTVFDHLFADGETARIGDYEGYVLETPGHTSVDVSYVFGDKVFVGDTLFMPDYGTARCDFPGGDARRLWKSIHKLLALPDETQLYMCHDYLPEGRSEFANMSTVAEQKRGNSWLQNTSEDEFVAKRQGRDKNLSVPALLYPALQVNVRAGHMPPAEDNGVSYMKIPISINE